MDHARRSRRRGYSSAITILILATVAVAAFRQGVFASLAHAGAKDGVRATRARSGPAQRNPLSSSLEAQPEDPAAEADALDHFAALGLPIHCGGGKKPYVALTFDDGPGPYTIKTLDILRAAGARATFFSVGKKLEDFPDVAKLELEAGALGDHTWTHRDMRGATAQELYDEVDRTREALADAAGHPVRMFRPPYGAHDASLDRYLKSSGLVEIMWSGESGDSAGVPPSVVLANAVAALRPGAIILMHENRGSTLSMLPLILQAVSNKGLHAVTVPYLLAHDPPSEAQLRAGGGCGLSPTIPPDQWPAS
jgi:peptidoglycan/xylan/chitin deacetylase (PgdA/CDA1 family)